MKTFKTITFGMMCLFGITVMAVEPNESSEISSVEETAVNGCSMVYDECDELYPTDFKGFDDCYSRGGC